MARRDKLLDGHRTSPEWEKAKPRLCVFPVGAFEQHSRHLPLATDNIVSENFAAYIAGELGAALLPTLNYGTSLEHSGFKGTVSLRPETLMQIVRDVADEVERQGFSTMILVTGHGGNFALAPVVRDINRLDRKLKILLIPCYAFRDDKVLATAAQGKPDIHAGEDETSVMLCLRPDLVKSGGPDVKPALKGFQQSDLTTFGIGRVAPQGAYGCPSLASREKGEEVIAAARRNMMKHIRERLKWLQSNRNYNGKGRARP